MPTTRLLHRIVASALFVLATAIWAAHAKECTIDGLQSPIANTLMVSPTNDAEAWILKPDCSIQVVAVEPDPWYADEEGDHTMLNCSSMGVEIVESLPKTDRIDLTENRKLIAANFSTSSKLYHVVLGWCDLVSVDHFIFPSQIVELELDGNPLTGIAEGVIPDSVQYMYFSESNLQSMANFSLPPSLVSISAPDNDLNNMKGILANSLSDIVLDSNPIADLHNVTFPESLKIFSCIDCGIKAISGVEFSVKLKTLNLGENDIREFEIREADLSVLQNMDSYDLMVAQTECKDSTAKLVKIDDDFTVCVITDDLFEQKYRSTDLAAATPTDDSSGSSSNLTLIISLSAAGAVVLLVAIFAIYRAHTRKSAQLAYKPYDTTDRTRTNPMFGTNGSAYNSQEYLSNDVRNDERLIPFRIGQDEISFGKLVAKGGYGVVSMATFRGRDVAVKQLLPDKARDSKAIKSFMDEIRMCAQLDHPKVVQFVGIAWSNLLDIAVVTEFMSGGDLTTVLHTQERPDPRFWYGPCSVLKSKTLVALDIVEGLVYLHSFESPILHRDLKTRNVLLNDEGVAKLSDFGISRELSLDNTMTGEIGTVAWIAPEVLQGERYSEKADIYSFGVVLAELDTGRHPYENNIDVDEDTRAPSSHTNTRIAMLVSAGALQPSLSKSCPQEVKALAARCMSYSAEDRPSAVEIHFALCQISEIVP